MQWTEGNAAYVGCMASKAHRWNAAQEEAVELPQRSDRDLIGPEHTLFAHMHAYAIAGSVAEAALVPNQHNLRHLDAEGQSLLS
jgi:hypothetical protein